MTTKDRRPVGFVVEEDTRTALFDAINQDDVESVAHDVGLSPMTLSKAVAGVPVSAQTVILAQRYVEDLDEGEDEDDDSDEDDGEDDDDSDDDGDDSDDDGED